MKNLIALICLAASCLCSTAIFSQTTFTGAVSTDWADPDNWDNGLPGPGNDATIPFGATVVNNGAIENSGTIDNFGTMVNNGTIANLVDNSDIVNSGTINNSGTIDNFGTILSNGYGFIVNSGTIDNFGTIDNAPGTIANLGNINNSGDIHNNGVIDNDGIIVNDEYGSIDNDGIMYNNETINNLGLLNNSGDVINTGLLDNSGDITNTGLLDNYGTIANNLLGLIKNDYGLIYNDLGVITNNGSIDSDFYGAMINTGFFYNYGDITNAYYGSILNTGFMDNTGVIENYGSIYSCTGIWNGSLPSGNPLVTTDCPPSLGGCTDIAACNYNPNAVEDDGSCILPDGCTDPAACNYDASVICDDGSCILLPDGCTDPAACNYDAASTCDDGTCDYGLWYLPNNVGEGPAIQACQAPAGYYLANQECIETVIAADPYCLDTNWDNLCMRAYNCCLDIYGCGDSSACNYDPEACGDNTLCVYPGCTDPAACNYDDSAGCDDGSCILPDGCTDPAACNYDCTAICDNGSCTYPGCTDPVACNYNVGAGCDDGSCLELDPCGVCGGATLAPAITGISGTINCQGGDFAYISGSNFCGVTSVTVSGAEAFIVASTQTEIIIEAPTGSGIAEVIVTTPAGSASISLAYTGPFINDLWHGSVSCQGGDFVSIVGNNLCGVTSVTVGGTEATIEAFAPDLIYFEVPAGSGIAEVLVTTPSGNASALLSYDQPIIIDVLASSISCQGGDFVSLLGGNLCDVTSVTVGGTEATIVVSEPNNIVIEVPAWSGSEEVFPQVLVTTPSGQSTAFIGYTGLGCTDPIACNYNALANCDDASCEYISCSGCIYAAASNYDATATIDDGSCVFEVCDVTSNDQEVYGAAYAAGVASVICPEVDPCPMDLNNDNSIGTSDLLELLGVFGTTCPE